MKILRSPTHLFLIIPVTLTISACAAVLPVASATYVSATSYSAASQVTKLPSIANRSDDDAIRDKNLATQADMLISGEIPKGRYLLACFNRKLLIVGEVSAQSDIAKVNAAVSKVGGVIEIWNYLSVASAPISQAAISSDASLRATTAKRLLERQMTRQDINSNNITVTVSQGVIYLMGSNVGNRQALDEVLTPIKNTNGVNAIVNLIEL